MRKLLIILVLAVFLGMFGGAVAQKEALLANGRVMILRLAPVDPRSLIQGDYMELDFDMERTIRVALRNAAQETGRKPGGGAVIVRLNADNLAEFARLDDGGELAPDEARLKFRWRNNGVRIASGSFFFQEGRGKSYDPAQFGELRVDTQGNPIIINLLDAEMRVIKPKT